MEGTVAVIIVFVAVSGIIGKHVYVPEKMIWSAAQSYCREHYTDLSPVSSERDTLQLISVSSPHNVRGWIGLFREHTNSSVWKWSGGGNVTYENWKEGQPDNYKYQENSVNLWSGGVWNDYSEDSRIPFYCLSLTVVRERKSWEEALVHCRNAGGKLASLVSETEVLLAKTEIQKANISGRVWIGLHFLSSNWSWVNGDRLKYRGWAPGDLEHQCPYWSRACGALTADGQWVNWGCEEKLHFICD